METIGSRITAFLGAKQRENDDEESESDAEESDAEEE